MSKELNAKEREFRIKDLFLKIFQEEGVSEEELKEAICQSYIDEGFNYKSFDEIPLEDMGSAIVDCYEAGGLSFENVDEVIEYYLNKED